ncbi:CD99 antigen [Onychomys torridus]|uniref:CD99 antigen n=1 Tax=Onychomys torridus TaxID=38674 RepID=UPI00167F801D|nr:CD99 antigen [Onychomys torridus]
MAGLGPDWGRGHANEASMAGLGPDWGRGHANEAPTRGFRALRTGPAHLHTPAPPTGDFSDTDLQDRTPGRGRGDGPRGGGSGDEEPQPEGSPQGLVPGLVAAAVAALAGAVSSFVAYQKKKFCFREAGPAPV